MSSSFGPQTELERYARNRHNVDTPDNASGVVTAEENFRQTLVDQTTVNRTQLAQVLESMIAELDEMNSPLVFMQNPIYLIDVRRNGAPNPVYDWTTFPLITGEMKPGFVIVGVVLPNGAVFLHDGTMTAIVASAEEKNGTFRA